ncbi:fucolectin-like [Pecten maximus]|uniref:fucolectin-like n=1 Tax=Pecten maximus TaxID=6579 RepID=UPI001457E5F3|nr:fucolectin-like [Pecten maximus]
MEEGCLLHTLLMALFVSAVIAEFRQNYFHADSRYDNVLPDGGTLHYFNVSSLVECAHTCFDQTDCVSVFYKEGQCVGWNSRMDDVFPTTASDNARYYELRGIYGNVAAGKPAVQSTTFPPLSGSYGAYKAVDGSRYPVAFQPDDSCSCTNKVSLEWWRVDLLDTYLITDVAVLKRRDDIYGMTLVNISIDMALSVAGPYTHCYNTGPMFSLTRFETFTCDTPTYGRYVKLSKLVKSYHCLCEVEIYVLP